MSDPFKPLKIKDRGEARKVVLPGTECPNGGCDGTARHRHDKDEGAFAFRVTVCDECEDWWKYTIPIHQSECGVGQ